MFTRQLLNQTAKAFENTNKQMSAIETETDFKSRIFAKTLTDAIHNVANEPSLGFYRIEEHVHKSNQNLLNRNYSQIGFNESLKGLSFDLNYSKDAMQKMLNSKTTFESIFELATDCIFKSRDLASKQNSNLPLGDIVNKSPNKNRQKKNKADQEKQFVDSRTTLARPVRSQSVLASSNQDPVETKTQRSQTMLLPSDGIHPEHATSGERTKFNPTKTDTLQTIGPTSLNDCDEMIEKSEEKDEHPHGEAKMIIDEANNLSDSHSSLSEKQIDSIDNGTNDKMQHKTNEQFDS